jgi:hypothetical protein
MLDPAELQLIFKPPHVSIDAAAMATHSFCPSPSASISNLALAELSAMSSGDTEFFLTFTWIMEAMRATAALSGRRTKGVE